MSAAGPVCRYLFVCGLHRTGTSLLTRLVAGHPEIDAITGLCDLPPIAIGANLHDGNARYEGAVRMNDDQAHRARPLGYGPDLELCPVAARVQHPLRAIREATCRALDNC